MAPVYLTMLKAIADFARIIDNPNAAKIVCITAPDEIPKTDTIPARLPNEMLLLNMYIVSDPGVMFSRIPEITNKVKLTVPSREIPPKPQYKNLIGFL